ncbi:MAG: phage major capsid protein [Bermanella sp.]
MKSIQQLREERKAAAAKMRNLVENHPEDKKWEPEQETQYQNMKSEVEGIDRQISAFEETLKLTDDQDQRIKDRAGEQNISTDEATNHEAQLKACTNAWLRGGVDNLTNDQRTFMRNEVQRANNAMGTQEANNGQALTHKEFVSRLLEAMKAFGGMRAVANVISTATGNAMDMPTTDATSEEGEIVGENAQSNNQDTTFGSVSVGAFKYSSKSIAVPFELLQDSGIDLEAYIIRLMSMRLARVQNKHFTVGDGVGKPTGIIPAAGVGHVGASASTIEFTELNQLIHSVDPAYREGGNCGFMFNDFTLRDLKDKKDTQGRPIWLPGVEVGAPDTIHGYRYTINQAMASFGANAKPVAFGDFNHYTIRDVMNLMMFRMTDSAFTTKGQVGFIGFQRSDGQLLDVGGAVKTLQNAAA